MTLQNHFRAVIALACLAQALAAGCAWCGTGSSAAEAGVIAYWPFDAIERMGPANDAALITREIVGGGADRIEGHCRTRDGVRGPCLQFNEFDSALVRAPGLGPAVNPRAFTLEAWIAPRSYPWNWCPLVMQRDDQAGYFFGLDADGRFGLQVAIGGAWRRCDSRPPYPGLETWHEWDSDRRKWIWQGSNDPGPPAPLGSQWGQPVVPLLAWSHLAATFDAGAGLRIYRNGKLEGRLDVKGAMTPAIRSEFRIGRDTVQQRPAHTERPECTLPIHYSFDGLLDEVKIHDRALSADEIRAAYERVQPARARPLEIRKLPTGPDGPGHFGACYAGLKYDEDYDRQWRLGDNEDIVVRFDDFPFKLVYWHGINFYPVWYSENGIGLMHEAVETWGKLGCHEALMDRQCRYSRVRIVQNNAARIRIHWRHALCNLNYELIHVDPATGWGDWCDDYLTIYPDGVAARELVHWCSALDKRHSYEQDNFVIPPGLTPTDILEPEAVTLANLDGGESQLSWAKTGQPEGREISKPYILKYNIKAKSPPFMIVHPALAKVFLEGNGVPWPHCFFWWDHWPVALIPSDGRQTHIVDGRPSSTSVTGISYTKDHPLNQRAANSLRQYWLVGMTLDKNAGQLAPLARSWCNAPGLTVATAGLVNLGYSLGQRCYELECGAPTNRPIEMTIAADRNAPVVNLALVLHHFGPANVALELDGEKIPRGKAFRYGHESTVDGVDLHLWISKEAAQPVRVRIVPQA